MFVLASNVFGTPNPAALPRQASRLLVQTHRLPRQPLVRERPNTPQERRHLWEKRYYKNTQYLK